MKNYFHSSYLQPFFHFFEQNKIDITSSNKYIPDYKTATQSDGLYLPLKNTAEWIQELEHSSEFDCISYQVGKTLGKKFIPDEALGRIHNSDCLIENYYELLKFITSTNSELQAGVYRQTDLNYKFTLSKSCFANKDNCWRPMEMLHMWILIHFFQRYFGKAWFPKEIGFCSYASIPQQLPKDFKNSKITLGNNEVYIVVDHKDLISSSSITTKSKPEINHQKNDIVENIKDVIRPILANSKISVEKVAQLLDTSPRSLQRELRLKGHNFRKVLTQYRVEVAMEHLLTSDLPVTEVASLVGYEKPTNFTRAFKKIYQKAPNKIKPHKDRILNNLTHSPAYQSH